ncbi:MAG: tRNA-binding protein [Flavobacteriales bacterium]|nr:tRNA-binding protein [Flavobacteriales bacterium]
MSSNQQPLNWSEFERVEMRVGTIISAHVFEEARNPAYKLSIDFGPEIGIRKSSAQITHHYRLEDLMGKQVIAVVNFPPKQIGPFMSECLVLGAVNADKSVILLQPERKTENGTQIG